MNIVENILAVFESFRMAPTAVDEYEAKGKQVLRERITPFVLSNQPIKFSMMGFPMKSPNNRDKVIGTLPDFAEQVTINTFKTFNQQVQAVYPPGILLAVVSDGYVFNDVMEVSDQTVQAYQEAAEDMVAGDKSIKWYNIMDFYDGGGSLATAREKLIKHFGITLTELERRILMDTDTNYLYRGMIRFMNLDLAIKDFTSNTQLQKASKIQAKEMMFRNEAYSKLVQTQFSDHIRLSMHQSVNNGTKYAFQLIKGTPDKIFTSAWHCALAIVDGEFETIHKRDAVARGLELVNNHGIPYYSN